VALNELISDWKPRRVDLFAFAFVMAGLVLVVPDWNFGSHAGLASALGRASDFTFAALTLLNRRLHRANGKRISLWRRPAG